MLDTVDEFSLNMHVELGEQVEILYDRTVQGVFQRHDAERAAAILHGGENFAKIRAGPVLHELTEKADCGKMAVCAFRTQIGDPQRLLKTA